MEAYYDLVTVNGRINPWMRATTTRPYRFRIVCASGYRLYNLTFAEPLSFWVIASDGGLLNNAVKTSWVLITPGERVEVIVDFGAATTSTATLMVSVGPTHRLRPVMQFRLDPQNSSPPPYKPPISLRKVPLVPPEDGFPGRNFYLHTFQVTSGRSQWRINDLSWDNVTEFPLLNSIEIWTWENPGYITHPMHLHGLFFRILDRIPMDDPAGSSSRIHSHEFGLKDTVAVGPRERVRILVRFDMYPGRYPYHCHLFTHEDDAMMRQFSVVHSASLCNSNGICDAQEDCVSCPSDCLSSSGAICGNSICELGNGESLSTCPQDCSGLHRVRHDPVLDACCGDSLCEGSWERSRCPKDCNVSWTSQLAHCGDGFCDYSFGESHGSCPQDCLLQRGGNEEGVGFIVVLCSCVALTVAGVVGVVVSFCRKQKQ